MKLILFDIDGTLLVSQGAGRAALRAAMEEVYGMAGPIDRYDFGGKTDNRIVTDLLTAVGLPPATINAKLSHLYACMAEKAVDIFPQMTFSRCPGIDALLETLRHHEQTLIGILTGNNHHTAPLKLRAAGIDPNQFLVNAYGSEAIDRNDLPAIAIERANGLTVGAFNGKNTVIIGDTPADILCAKAVGATAVAVATGWQSTKSLSHHRPDYLFDNLANTAQVLDVLLGNRRPDDT
jgi:phosphoglycolate phosphatase-like HAD superfamily hydrolase